jgi:hypothetical protein
MGRDPFTTPVNRVVVAAIDRTAGGYSATVALEDPSGRLLGRQELGYRLDSCEELAGAIELAIAVAIDPLAVAPRSEPSAASPERRISAGPSLATLEAPAEVEGKQSPVQAPATEPTKTELPRAGQPAITAERETASPEDAQLPDWRTSVGIGAAFQAAPATIPAFSVGLERRFGHLSLGIEIRGDAAGAEALSAGGSVRTWLLTGGADGCYHHGVFGACGLIAAGAQHSSGTGLSPSLSSSTPYVALGARLQADLPLVRWLWLRPQIDAWVPLIHTTLKVEDAPVWQTPAVSPVVGLGLVAQLP